MIINLSERPAFDQQRSKLDNEHKHDLGSKSHERQSWLAPLFGLLVVIVIDSLEVSAKHPSLVFVHVRQQRPAFDPATVKSSITPVRTYPLGLQ